MMVCRHIPPAPGPQLGPVSCFRRPDSSVQVAPPLVDLKRAASSTPAYTVSSSVSDGSRCQTLLNSQGRWVPSKCWWVPGTPSYTNLLLSPCGQPWGVTSSSGLLPGVFQVLPPSSE